MTLTDSFELLMMRLDALLATLRDLLQWAVTQAKPLAHDHVLVSRYEDSVVELIADVEVARCSANAAQLELSNRKELAGACLALVDCQRQSNKVAKRFFHELVSFEALSNLERLAAEQREPWASWVQGVKDALERCRTPITDVGEATVCCWQEVSDIVEQFRRNPSTGNSIRDLGQVKQVQRSMTNKA